MDSIVFEGVHGDSIVEHPSTRRSARISTRNEKCETQAVDHTFVTVDTAAEARREEKLLNERIRMGRGVSAAQINKERKANNADV